MEVEKLREREGTSSTPSVLKAQRVSPRFQESSCVCSHLKPTLLQVLVLEGKAGRHPVQPKPHLQAKRVERVDRLSAWAGRRPDV